MNPEPEELHLRTLSSAPAGQLIRSTKSTISISVFIKSAVDLQHFIHDQLSTASAPADEKWHKDKPLP